MPSCKPDNSDPTPEPLRDRLAGAPRSPKPPTPESASEFLSGQAAAIDRQLGVGVEIRIFRAIGVTSGGGCLALLVARKAAIAARAAEIAALDAERKLPR